MSERDGALFAGLAALTPQTAEVVDKGRTIVADEAVDESLDMMRREYMLTMLMLSLV